MGSAQGSATATLTLSVPNARAVASPGPATRTAGMRGWHAAGARSMRSAAISAMRSISVVAVGGVAKVDGDGQPTFMLGTLDQGYGPMAATRPRPPRRSPTTSRSRGVGSNAVRKHMKVEPQERNHDTDRLGLLVGQDMPALAVARPDAAAQSSFCASCTDRQRQH